MAKPLTEQTAKQLEKTLAKARREWGRSGSVASLTRLTEAEVEIARRAVA